MFRLPYRAPTLLLLATLSLALPACDEVTGNDDDPEKAHDPALVGDWVAISALYTNMANSAQHFDGIREAGGFTRVTFEEDGIVALTEYDTWIHEMVEDNGTWYTDGSSLVIDWDSDPGSDTVTYHMSGDHVVVDIGEEDIDFNGDGIDELARFVLTFADLSESPDPALVGSWTATAMVFTSVEDPETSVDVIQYGAELSLVVNADGTYAVEITHPDEPTPVTETESGLYTSIEGLLWVYDTSSADPQLALLFYSVDGSAATLAHHWDEEFDFDDDGVDDPATLTITLVKD